MSSRTIRELCITHIFLTRIGFSSVSRSKDRDLVFSVKYQRGMPAPLPVFDGISPIDTLRKDSALRLGRARRGPPVTSEKPALVTKMAKIVRFCKGLK